MHAATLTRPLIFALRGLDALQSVFALATRWYVSWVFLKSSWLKLTSWDVTLSLFKDEYRVPLLPAPAAAVLGTAVSCCFPRSSSSGWPDA